MSRSICEVKNCGRPHRLDGLCQTHLWRLQKYGDIRADVPIAKRRPFGLDLAGAFRYFMPEEPPEPGIIWPWRGPLCRKGYGMLGHRGRTFQAHRVSYEIFRDQIPAGLMIRHKNDTPIDVNPWNLEIGTALDNSTDMVARNRETSGSRHGNTHLTEANVIKIRQLRSKGWTQVALGTRFGINDRTVGNIVRRETWRHI
jgi:hypothetical protein